MRQRFCHLLLVVFVVLITACGGSATSEEAGEGVTWSPEVEPVGGLEAPVDPEDLEAEAEEHLERLVDAYRSGFEDACSEVWSRSPDGALYYDGVGYWESECLAGLDDGDESVLTAVGAGDAVEALEAVDESDAHEAGASDAYDVAFDLSPIGVLCSGHDCFERDDF